MMYQELYQYFVLHKELSVPGIGTFLLERKPAEIDFPNKEIKPPAYSVQLQFPAAAPPTSFFSWLANRLAISDREAVIRFNDFAFDLKQQILNGDKIEWKGMGTLHKGLAGEVKFFPLLKGMAFEKPVAAEKVIREHADHMVKVGEEEKTAAEMTAILNQPEVKRSTWWTWALIAGLLAVMFMGWYFSENGISVASTANSAKVVPAESSPSYKVLP